MVQCVGLPKGVGNQYSSGLQVPLFLSLKYLEYNGGLFQTKFQYAVCFLIVTCTCLDFIQLSSGPTRTSLFRLDFVS